MVRNLVLSTYMSDSLAVQEKILRESWLIPFELPYSNKMDSILAEFVTQDKFNEEGRYYSEIEKKLKVFMKGKLKGFKLYVRFVSLYEDRMRNLPEDKVEAEINALLEELSKFAAVAKIEDE